MIVRNRPNKNFSTIRNDVLVRPDLSLKAKGLWAFLMSKPDNWKTDIRTLSRLVKEGKHAVGTALQELKAAGLYRKERHSIGNGHFVWEDFVYDSPCPGFPVMDNPVMENRDILVKTELVNTELTNTDEPKEEIPKVPTSPPEGGDEQSSIADEKIGQLVLKPSTNLKKVKPSFNKFDDPGYLDILRQSDLDYFQVLLANLFDYHLDEEDISKLVDLVGDHGKVMVADAFREMRKEGSEFDFLLEDAEKYLTGEEDDENEPLPLHGADGKLLPYSPNDCPDNDCFLGSCDTCREWSYERNVEAKRLTNYFRDTVPNAPRNSKDTDIRNRVGWQYEMSGLIADYGVAAIEAKIDDLARSGASGLELAQQFRAWFTENAPA